jgi:ABC-2 type transport system permease protein
MAATTFVTTPPVAPVRRTNYPRLTIADTFKAEWTKLRTLRSTWYTIGGAVFASVGLAALICIAQVSQWDQMSAKQRLEFDPTSTALIGVLFAAVILGTLAVRAITNEYSSGMIRVTFTAIPGRKGVLAAKAVLLGAVAFPVALITNVASFFIARQILAGKGVSMSLGQTGVIQAIVFGALAVSLVTVFGLGLGGIIRRTAGATTALMLATIGSQIFGIALPAGARQYLPGAVIQAIVTVKHTSGLLAPGSAVAVLAAYAVVTLAIASRLIAARDA